MASKTTRLLLLVLAAALLAPGAWADERILSFHSDITVHEDRWLTVTETIRVRAEGKQIKRGIFRAFPTVYRGHGAAKIRVPCQVVSTERDGQPEAHHTKKQGQFLHIYLGREEHLLDPGEYTYRITYRTTRQLGFFDEHDELYWNVTGNEWAFPIDAVAAVVRLPSGVPMIKVGHEGYTGPKGAKGKDYRSWVSHEGAVHFESTRPYPAGEGVTLVATWPKGFITEPTRGEKAQAYLLDNLMVGAGLLGLLLTGGYFLFAWILVGRDPPEGVVIPLFEPPENLDAAAVRYIHRMKYDKRCFTATILDMAVKGYHDIEEAGGDFALQRKSSRKVDRLSPAENEVGTLLFGLKDRLVLEKSQHRKLQSAITALRKSLHGRYLGTYFVPNSLYFVPGVLLTILTYLGVGAAALILGRPEVAFLALWLTGWTAGTSVLVVTVAKLWIDAFKRGGSAGEGKRWGSAGCMTLFALPFIGGEIGVGAFLIWRSSIWLAPILISLVLLCIKFHFWLKRPTPEGRRVMDGIEGFRMYLGTAEQESFEHVKLLVGGPKRTPELFERYLPYALALDVEAEWAEKFQDVLAMAAESAEGGYSPTWYSGTSLSSMTSGAFASSLSSSLSSSISSASTSPSSSSGSGGGGSSGGGGGGGGGGGW